MFEVREPTTKKEIDSMYDLRWRMLRKPWKQPKGSEKDELDGTYRVWNVVAVHEDRVVATARLHKNSDNEGQIRFMCVDDSYSNLGLGSKMAGYLHDRARKLGLKRIVANVRENAKDFYLKQGYVVTGEAQTLFGQIEQVRMEKNLME